MGFFRSLFAVIAATAAAFLLGMAFDYFRMAMGLQTEGLLMVFPAVAGAGGFIAAIIALLAAGGGRPSAREPGGRPRQASAAQGGKSREAVPGMPTFDFDKAQQSVKGQDKAEE